jgi:hypothetical protein
MPRESRGVRHVTPFCRLHSAENCVPRVVLQRFGAPFKLPASPHSLDVHATLHPIHCRRADLANRIVMAPLTRNRAPDAIPTPLMATYYRSAPAPAC